MYGTPWLVRELVTRVLQCVFAAASIGIMVSSSGFSTSTAFCYLIASMGTQFLWSFVLGCLEIHALRINKDLDNHILVPFIICDWVLAVLSLSASCASAGVVVLLASDTQLCKTESALSCKGFQISIAMAFISWFFLAMSSPVVSILVGTR